MVSVGVNVGDHESFTRVGPIVGLLVILVGLRVGDRVVWGVGFLLVGGAVGFSVGLHVAPDKVGAIVGTVVATLGELVGALVGFVGDLVGLKVGCGKLNVIGVSPILFVPKSSSTVAGSQELFTNFSVNFL